MTDNATAYGQTGNVHAVKGTLIQGLAVLDAMGSSARGFRLIAGDMLACAPLVDIVF